MQIKGFLTVVAFMGFAGGCEKPVANMNARPAPNGGAMFPLPGNAGFVAVATERVEITRGAKPKQPASTIVARFYQADGKTPLEPAPTEVAVKIGSAEDSASVSLTPSAGEEKLSSRFASPRGEYPDGLQGTISAKISGQVVEASFSAR